MDSGDAIQSVADIFPPSVAMLGDLPEGRAGRDFRMHSTQRGVVTCPGLHSQWAQSRDDRLRYPGGSQSPGLGAVCRSGTGGRWTGAHTLLMLPSC